MAGLVAAGYERLGYDTIAPVFSTQHEADALGCEVDWGRPDLMPDGTRHPCRTAEDIRIPEDFLAHPAIKVVLDCLRLLKHRYGDGPALIGKVFGPWTLGYHLFGVENFLLKIYDDPDDLRRILDKLKPLALLFAEAQREAGADAITLGDHATGDLVGPRHYEQYLWPIHAQLAEQFSGDFLLHICGDTGDRLDLIARSGLAAFHFDSKVPAARAREIVGDRVVLIGNVNNPRTLLFGTPEDVRREVGEILAAGIEIVGPECAIPLTTPTENLRAVVQGVTGAR
jgi:[methyl-Co(III) methanol-specific corrinoid protein]:coenzyme M methyltransferase